MKSFICSCSVILQVLFLTLLLTVPADAQDKVVVIPLLIDRGPPTVTSATGRIWMDRNLGALRVATKSIDPDAYGSLYQWGRLTDGHEYRASGTSGATSSANVPGHDDFILDGNTNPYDWRVPQENSLWQGGDDDNNPCPDGFRLPTRTEWQNEALSWAAQNAAGAFASPLKLVVSGSRSKSTGSILNAGIVGWYWSSTPNGISAGVLTFGDSGASLSALYRGYGLSVRCIKD